MKAISIQFFLSDDVWERWEKLIRDRGYTKSSLIRVFIEAVTDPARGPRVERIIQNREPKKEVNNG